MTPDEVIRQIRRMQPGHQRDMLEAGTKALMDMGIRHHVFTDAHGRIFIAADVGDIEHVLGKEAADQYRRFAAASPKPALLRTPTA